MPKSAKRGEDEPVETGELGSPPKKAKTKEYKVTSKVATAVSNRPPRAVKTRAAAAAAEAARVNNGEQNNNNVEPKKGRGRPGALRRSNSSDSIGPKIVGGLKKSRVTKSDEHLDQKAPPGKKNKNAPVKGAKKTAPKKAAIEAKPRKRATKEASPEASDDEAAEARPPMIAKKSYARGASKKAGSTEDTKEDDEKPKKRAVAKKAASGGKATRGRGKAAPNEGDEEAEDAKPAKPKKARANGRKTAAPPVVEEEKDVEGDEENTESFDAEEAAPDDAKPKRGRKLAAAPKRPRGKKAEATAAEKGVASQDDESLVEAVATGPTAEEPEESKPASKTARKGKAPAAKSRPKEAEPMPDEDELNDEEADDRVNENGENRSVHFEPQLSEEEPEDD